jgi:hypothetical protein
MDEEIQPHIETPVRRSRTSHCSSPADSSSPRTQPTMRCARSGMEGSSGYGPLMGKYGLVTDNLLSAQVRHLDPSFPWGRQSRAGVRDRLRAAPGPFDGRDRRGLGAAVCGGGSAARAVGTQWLACPGAVCLPGGYVNLLDEREQHRVPLAFGLNYERLRALKRKYDPEDLFHSTTGHITPLAS